MLEKGTLHLKRTDPVTRALDDIIIPPDEPEVAVGINGSLIPRIIESVYKRGSIRFRAVYILHEEADRAGIDTDSDPSFLSLLDRPPFVIMELYVPSRRRPPH